MLQLTIVQVSWGRHELPARPPELLLLSPVPGTWVPLLALKQLLGPALGWWVAACTHRVGGCVLPPQPDGGDGEVGGILGK